MKSIIKCNTTTPTTVNYIPLLNNCPYLVNVFFKFVLGGDHLQCKNDVF